MFGDLLGDYDAVWFDFIASWVGMGQRIDPKGSCLPVTNDFHFIAKKFIRNTIQNKNTPLTISKVAEYDESW